MQLKKIEYLCKKIEKTLTLNKALEIKTINLKNKIIFFDRC